MSRCLYTLASRGNHSVSLQISPRAANRPGSSERSLLPNIEAGHTGVSFEAVGAAHHTEGPLSPLFGIELPYAGSGSRMTERVIPAVEAAAVPIESHFPRRSPAYQRSA